MWEPPAKEVIHPRFEFAISIYMVVISAFCALMVAFAALTEASDPDPGPLWTSYLTAWPLALALVQLGFGALLIHWIGKAIQLGGGQAWRILALVALPTILLFVGLSFSPLGRFAVIFSARGILNPAKAWRMHCSQ